MRNNKVAYVNICYLFVVNFYASEKNMALKYSGRLLLRARVVRNGEIVFLTLSSLKFFPFY